MAEVKMIFLSFPTNNDLFVHPNNHLFMVAIVLNTISFKTFTFFSEFALLLSCFKLIDRNILSAKQNHICLSLIQLNTGDGMLDVQISVVFETSEGIRIVKDDLMGSFLKDRQKEQPRLSILSSCTVPCFCPKFNKFHLYLLIELDSPLKGAHNLISQRVKSDHPRTLVYDILMFLFYMIHI